MKRTVPGVVARAGDVARRLGITRGLRQRLPRWGAECGPDETRVLLLDALFHYTSRLCVGWVLRGVYFVRSRLRAMSQIG